MPVNDDLGKRMKEFYEQVPKTRLMHRCPVACRIDGRSFHTFTKGMMKPFDDVLMVSMQETMKYLCENIQGCVFGYTQSDEITLILVDYQTLNSSAWFDYEVQKMCSIGASMATMQFNKVFAENVKLAKEQIELTMNKSAVKYMETLNKAVEKGAMFDARFFNIPKEEVTNLVYWRQLDATRNSIQMVGQANFSHKELQGKSCNMIQDMLHEQKGINWNNYATPYKRGTACVKKDIGWVLDCNMPILKGEDRAYVDKLVFVGED